MPELAPRADETSERRAARIDAVIGSRVPDIQFLLDYVLGDVAAIAGQHRDGDRIGIVGHSFGGWTALAVPDVDRRIRAVVA